MKRKKIEKERNEYNIRDYYTFFKWTTCDCCGLEFRRETGKMADEPTAAWERVLVTEYLHFCNSCGNNVKDFIEGRF